MLDGEEILEALSGDEFVKEGLSLRRCEGGAVEIGLHTLEEPIALGFVGDIGELDADGAAIGGAQLGEKIAKGSVERAEEIAVGDAFVQIGEPEAELAEFEERMGVAVVAEGVELGDEVA